MSGGFIKTAIAFPTEFPKTAGLLAALWAAGVVGMIVADLRRPPPPPPAPWTAQERAMISKCAESSSAGWCADNVLRLRDVLQ
jgi:hypothetical protein